MKFNYLTVIDKTNKRKCGRVVWKCMCDCGAITYATTSELNNNAKKSCGCLKKEKINILNKNKKKINDIKEFNSFIIMYATNTQQEIIIDKEQYDIVKNYCWRTDANGYVVTSVFNNKTNKNNKIIRLHRLLMNVTNNSKLIVDHIDGNKLNNSLSNLRICSQANNTKNHCVSKNNTSSVTGVKWNKINKNWRATININNKTINLGSFKDFNNAVQARKEAERKYFGEYVRQEI